MNLQFQPLFFSQCWNSHLVLLKPLADILWCNIVIILLFLLGKFSFTVNICVMGILKYFPPQSDIHHYHCFCSLCFDFCFSSIWVELDPFYFFCMPHSFLLETGDSRLHIRPLWVTDFCFSRALCSYLLNDCLNYFTETYLISAVLSLWCWLSGRCNVDTACDWLVSSIFLGLQHWGLTLALREV